MTDTDPQHRQMSEEPTNRELRDLIRIQSALIGLVAALVVLSMAWMTGVVGARPLFGSTMLVFAGVLAFQTISQISDGRARALRNWMPLVSDYHREPPKGLGEHADRVATDGGDRDE